MTITEWRKLFRLSFNRALSLDRNEASFHRNWLARKFPMVRNLSQLTLLQVNLLAYFIATERLCLDRVLYLKEENVAGLYESLGVTTHEAENSIERLYHLGWLLRRKQGHFFYYLANIKQLQRDGLFYNKWHYFRKIGIYRHLNLN